MLVPVKLITYPGPGALADDIANLDIGNIANETERAKTIEFSPAYCNIQVRQGRTKNKPIFDPQATYLVRPGSLLQTIEDVDTAGVRIVAKERSAYDLWLTEHIAAAEIVRTASIEQSFAEWRDGGHEVLAGLRPKLLEEAARRPGARILPGSFTVIGQVGIRVPQFGH